MKLNWLNLKRLKMNRKNNYPKKNRIIEINKLKYKIYKMKLIS